MKTSRTLYRPAVRVALGVALILSLRLVAMQFSDEVVWSLADFVVAGALLTTIGVALEPAARKTGNRAAALGLAAGGVAAGIFGQADDAPRPRPSGHPAHRQRVRARRAKHSAQRLGVLSRRPSSPRRSPRAAGGTRPPAATSP
jgi:hypothetical protein